MTVRPLRAGAGSPVLVALSLGRPGLRPGDVKSTERACDEADSPP